LVNNWRNYRGVNFIRTIMETILSQVLNALKKYTILYTLR